MRSNRAVVFCLCLSTILISTNIFAQAGGTPPTPPVPKPPSNETEVKELNPCKVDKAGDTDPDSGESTYPASSLTTNNYGIGSKACNDLAATQAWKDYCKTQGANQIPSCTIKSIKVTSASCRDKEGTAECFCICGEVPTVACGNGEADTGLGFCIDPLILEFQE